MLGICYLCLAQHYSEGFYFYFFSRAQIEHVSTEESPSFVKNSLADSGTAAEAWAEWALLVQQGCTQRPLCRRTHQGVSRYPDSWQTVASPAFHVAPSLVTTASPLVTLERAQRNSPFTVLFFPKATIFRERDQSFVTPLNLFGSK